MSDASIHTSITADQFRIGRVLTKALSVFGRQFWKFLALGLVSLIPLLIYTFFAAPHLRSTHVGANAFLLSNGLNTVTRFLVQTLVQSTSVYGALQAIRGEPFEVRQSWIIGLRRLLPVLGVSVLAGLAIGLGIALLLIPGLIAICMFYVAIPVCVAERRGVLPSLDRSAELTKGYRWPIFGLLLLVIAVAFVVLVVSFTVPYVLIASGIKTPTLTKIFLAREIVDFAWLAISSSLSSVLATAVYDDLRMIKEGVGPGNLAAVFD